ncbi:MAG: glycerate kinase, partial [Clostridiales bacterium]|nr:glycerate kinase [Clostridiales bacterium]
MRIVLAPDSFKGSATALEVCQAMKDGIQRACSDAEIIMAPVTDGGEGLVENLAAACGGERVEVQVTGPAGKPVTAQYAILPGGEAVIEMAQAAGLTLLAEAERNPLETTTYGVGQMIRDALDRGCKSFLLGLGGSATNDGGCGMAAALGYAFLDEAGREISPGGGHLGELTEIKTDKVDPRLADADFVAACDVRNPLCGENGASYVFGPQKGATPDD